MGEMKLQIEELHDLAIEDDSRLSEWEQNFIFDLHEKVSKGIKLSTKQVQKIEQIHERIF